MCHTRKQHNASCHECCPARECLSFCTCPSPCQVVLRQLHDDVQYRVIARGDGADPAGDAAALADYFNLSHSLAALAPGWAAACTRFAAVHPLLPGARMLRQDPVECLFQVGAAGARQQGCGRGQEGLWSLDSRADMICPSTPGLKFCAPPVRCT